MKLIVLLAACVAYVAAAAEKCPTDGTCSISNSCRCSSTASPITGEDVEAPQLISLTFDEAVVDNVYTEVWEPLLFDRTNPDGAPISGTFFVAHEYTNYTRVQDLYVQGFEIGVNSITKNSLAQYWAEASEDTLEQEFGGQRTIISTFANIPIDDIIGARTPQLQIEGDVSIEGYVAGGLQYDSSWTSRSNTRLFPYTLDYKSTQECRTGTTCPTDAHPGFWVLPIINIQGTGGVECNSLSICNVAGSADDIATWLMGEVDRVRNNNKAPLTIMMASSWFRFTNNSYDGFDKFLTNLASQNDVFLVSQKQVLDWIKSPVALSDFKTDVAERESTCEPSNCELLNSNGETRYMASCVPCPEAYPWLGNPTGEGS